MGETGRADFDISKALACLEEASHLYSRLAIIVGASGAGKSALMATMANRLSGKVVNVNLEISKRMLALTSRQRTLELGRLLSEALSGDSSTPAFLDNIEMLFEPTLAQDTIRLLKSVARDRTVVVTWNGRVVDGFLTYAEPAHPEYYRTPVKDLLVLTQGTVDSGHN